VEKISPKSRPFSSKKMKHLKIIVGGERTGTQKGASNPEDQPFKCRFN